MTVNSRNGSTDTLESAPAGRHNCDNSAATPTFKQSLQTSPKATRYALQYRVDFSVHLRISFLIHFNSEQCIERIEQVQYAVSQVSSVYGIGCMSTSLCPGQHCLLPSFPNFLKRWNVRLQHRFRSQDVVLNPGLRIRLHLGKFFDLFCLGLSISKTGGK